jgi:Fur family transcriptional regulator, ferric uptake regulator
MPTSDGDPTPAVPAELVSLLRRAGLCMTSQRATVLAALGDVGPHPTAEAVAERAQELDPGLHLATVYRTLHLLEEHQVVSHVHLGHGPAVYHRAHERHAHAVCVACGHAFEVPEALLDPFADELAGRLGFVLDPGHFALSGWCDHCARQAGVARRPVGP